MSNFILFPFTHMTKAEKRIVHVFFEEINRFATGILKTATAEPMASENVANANMVVHSCDGPTEARVEQQFIQYLEWVKIHKGNERNLKALLKDNPYFTGDNQVTAIKSRLKDNQGSAENESSNMNPVDKNQTDQEYKDRCLLFLKMADLWDSQNDSINAQLADIEKTKDALFTSLRGEEDKTGETVFLEHPEPFDPGQVMTRDRIISWAACMLRTDLFPTKTAPVFVTTSHGVFDYLESICETSVNALDIDEIKVHENDCENKKLWQQAFADMVICAAAGDEIPRADYPIVNDTCSLTGQCKLNFFSGNEINRHFNLSDNQVVVCLVRLK